MDSSPLGVKESTDPSLWQREQLQVIAEASSMLAVNVTAPHWQDPWYVVIETMVAVLHGERLGYRTIVRYPELYERCVQREGAEVLSHEEAYAECERGDDALRTFLTFFCALRHEHTRARRVR